MIQRGLKEKSFKKAMIHQYEIRTNYIHKRKFSILLMNKIK